MAYQRSYELTGHNVRLEICSMSGLRTIPAVHQLRKVLYWIAAPLASLFVAAGCVSASGSGAPSASAGGGGGARAGPAPPPPPPRPPPPRAAPPPPAPATDRRRPPPATGA